MELKFERINDDLVLYQDKEALCLSTDAYLLSSYVKKDLKGKAAELGTGSGIISLFLVTKGKLSHIDAIEIQDSISKIAKLNVEENCLEDKITIINSDIRSLDSNMNGKYSTVFSNPPYMKMENGKLNITYQSSASRHELNGDIKDFCKTASKLLKHGGSFYVVYRPDRLSDLIQALKESKLEPKRMTLVYPSINHEPSLVILEAKKGASSGIFITRPLIIYDDIKNDSTPNGYTKEMKYIYENGDINEFYKKP